MFGNESNPCIDYKTASSYRKADKAHLDGRCAEEHVTTDFNISNNTYFDRKFLRVHSHAHSVPFGEVSAKQIQGVDGVLCTLALQGHDILDTITLDTTTLDGVPTRMIKLCDNGANSVLQSSISKINYIMFPLKKLPTYVRDFVYPNRPLYSNIEHARSCS